MRTTNEHRIAEEVERTLRAFDHEPPLEGDPYLAGRIAAEMNSRSRQRHPHFPLRVDLRYVFVLLILLVHLITVVHYVQWNSTHTLHENLVSRLEEDFQIDRSHIAF